LVSSGSRWDPDPNDLLAGLVTALKQQAELLIFDNCMQQIAYSAAVRRSLEQLAVWRIGRAANVGPERAVDDLEHYISADKYDVDETCLLAGVTVTESIEVADGIFLVPFESRDRSHRATVDR
jgi:hypothetical protein